MAEARIDADIRTEFGKALPAVPAAPAVSPPCSTATAPTRGTCRCLRWSSRTRLLSRARNTVLTPAARRQADELALPKSVVRTRSATTSSTSTCC